MRRVGGAVLILGVVGLVVYGWLTYSSLTTDSGFRCGSVDVVSESVYQNDTEGELCLTELADRRDQIRLVGWAALVLLAVAGGLMIALTLDRDGEGRGRRETTNQHLR